MTKNYLLALMMLVGCALQAQVVKTTNSNLKTQEVDIPDENFLNALIEAGIDTDGSNSISIAEAEAVTQLNVNNKNITDLQGIEAFKNLQELHCSNNQLTALDITKNTSLTYLDCGNNQINALDVTKNTSLTRLDCYSNQLTALDVTKNTSLTYLYCSNNQLTALDVTKNTSLTYLYCYNNQLTALDVTKNTSLTRLDCYYNQLTTLDVTQNTSLTRLFCSNNQLTVLDVTQNTSLTHLYCSNNQLTVLDVTQNTSLTRLECGNNQLTTLDVTQNTSLTYLFCHNNQLTALDLDVTKNTSLTHLYCYYNQLTTLDVTKNTSLTYLYCSNNQLTALDVTKNTSLTYLYCSNNQLTALDVTQNTSLTRLECDNNQLTALDVTKNTKLEILNVSIESATELDLKNNPYLKSLYCDSETLRFLYLKSATNFFIDWTNCENPSNASFYLITPNIEYICADESELECIQKKLDENGYTNCNIGTNCIYGKYKITGQTTFDADNNGCDANDSVIPFVKYGVTNTTTNDSFTYIGAQSGQYTIPLDAGAYTVATVFENPTYFTSTPASVNVAFPTTPSPFNQDFCIASNGTHNDVEIIVVPLTQARPGFTASYKLLYKNKGNTVVSGNITLAYTEDYMNFNTAFPNVSAQTNGLLTWEYQDLLPNETKTIVFSMTLNPPNHASFPLNSGDILTFTGTINPIENDETPKDNIHTLNQTVVNSYDPNDIRCLEGATIQEDEVGNFVHYIIRFENEGTASAVNISIKNEIDTTKFDIGSLIPLYGSHPFTTTITEGNKLEFRFEGINLPHEENNQGYVVFKLKTASNLSAGDTFEETADIFFDYNDPITTNTAITTVEGTLSNAKFNDVVAFYPNPVKHSVLINSKEQITSVSLLDISGRVIKTKAVNSSLNANLDVNHILSGSYFIKIKTVNNTYIKRIIKK